jgi:hypothetical protein
MACTTRLLTQLWRFTPLDVSACSWTAGHQLIFISVSLRNTWLRLVLRSTARSSRQTTTFTGRSPSVFLSGSLATRRNVSCSSGNDGPIYMLSSNLACHSAGLSVHGLFTDIELDSSAGHLATTRHVCFAQVFPCAISI